ncbi:lipid IV(A) palmitoyltransferase PagP [Methylotenera versatilis]|uniref:Lipid A acyltransferase PagP n=1 Tax=Methylotenera versatilis (strain 301) TaxID=666681 RepID=D7DPY2_METV0|nr:lipid IV(A) palmitoyltransferase PagP [Methylotenera versatilis]ADI29353.1 Antimicrobial peptide resistance and lipid A acylation PagP [Methylotenera versatilis 301]
MKFRFITSALFIIMSTSAVAEESAKPSIWSRAQDSLSKTWQSQDYELYVPINTWHNRSYYTQEKIDEYNERPWGLGIGKYRFDEDGDWHALYAMAFEDSHDEIEPVAGYGFQKTWRPAEDVRLGLGYTVGVTMRGDMHYIPIPIIAPLFSVDYKKLALQSTYIFGGEGNGNILFTWVRWQLD